MRSRTQSFSLTHDRVVVYQHGDGMRSGEQPGTDGAIFAGQHGRQRWGSGPRGEIGHPPWQGVPPAGTDVPAGTEPLRIILLRERHIQIPVPGTAPPLPAVKHLRSLPTRRYTVGSPKRLSAFPRRDEFDTPLAFR